MFRRVVITCAIAAASMSSQASGPSFIDGYHGGVYGHYPLWNTQFYVDKLAEHPQWRINLEIEPETWDTVKFRTPEAYAAFRAIAACERVEFVNPTYAQPYMYNISGESIIRQFEYGMAKVNSHFPDVKFVTYSAEEPCFTAAMPQILRGFGYKYASLKCPNTCWGGYMGAYGGETVNWIGADGSSILTVPRYAAERLQENSVWQTEAWGNSDEYLKACADAGIKNIVGMCLQDAGWKNGPWIGHGNKIKNGSVYRTWREYFETVTAPTSSDNWRVSQDDVLPGLMWGSQILQQLAQNVRAAENRVVMAEKINLMEYLTGGTAADSTLVADAWRTLMMAQHHDSWIVPYNGLSKGRNWAQAVEEWTAHSNSIADQLIEGQSTKGGALRSVRVFNTTSDSRSEMVNAEFESGELPAIFRLSDHRGKSLPYTISRSGSKSIVSFTANVGAMGYSNYYITPGTPAPEAKVVCRYYEAGDSFIIESDMYKIAFDLSQGGTIVSLVAKHLDNKEFVDQSAEFRFNELRGHFYDESKFRSNRESKATASIAQSTAGVVSVEIVGEIAGSPCVQSVTLRAGEELIDCGLKIDWKGNPGIGEFRSDDTWGTNRRPFYDSRYKLLLMFPAALEGQQVYKNAPFDVCKSEQEDTFYGTWDSIKHNVVLNWVDLLQRDGKYGMTMLSDHTTSYTHGKDFPAALTVQYSGKGLWGADYKITGPTQMRYALMPHANSWDKEGVWSSSVRWNEPLLVKSMSTDKHEPNRSFAQFSKAGYEITAAYVRGTNIYLRLFNAESDDKPLKVNFGFPVAEATQVMLDGSHESNLAIKKSKGGSQIEVSMPRFGIKTIKIN